MEVTDLISFLNNTPAVFSYFGNRITSDDVPNGQTYPYAVIFTVSAPEKYTYMSACGGVYSYQIDVYSDDKAQLDTGYNLIKNALSGYRGVMGNSVAGFVFVNGGPDIRIAEDRNYRRILEVRIGSN